MPLVLSSDNVVDYLRQQRICTPEGKLNQPVRPKEYKNFNLIVSFTDNTNYLVKQERFNNKGEASGCLKYEWILQQLLANFPELQSFQDRISQAICFDADNAIIVLNYFSDYISLSHFYGNSQDYPQEIAATIGANLAQIHKLTYEKSEYQEFLTRHSASRGSGATPNFLLGLERVGVGIFAHICSNGLEFFKLYQRYPSLHQAVASLYANYKASCLIHGDIKFSNYLIPQNNTLENCDRLKLIDWELFAWGDPALDLGTLVAQYLEVWLESVYADRDTDINISLSLASCPLEKIQPSIKAVLRSYLSNFPQILALRADYLTKVVQFAGLGLIKHLQQKVEEHQPFDNSSICTLQVAKSLLCYPEQSMATVLGRDTRLGISNR